MCGIVGYKGKNNVVPILIKGLENLEYRGYDSSGIAYIIDNELVIKKESGKLINLKNIVSMDEKSNMGIGHTRWATHGEPTITNSHPHSVGDITLVHNGIVENYAELKREINYSSISETDSEVLAAYINKLYQEHKDMLKVLPLLEKYIKGSYALGIIVKNNDNLYCTKKDSPLIVGTCDDGYYIASDVPAILDYTNKYYILENYEFAVISDDVKFYNEQKSIDKELKTYEFDIESAKKNGYEHFMLKEIEEQKEVLYDTLHAYFDGESFNLPDLSKYTAIDIIGCGSAYHVGYSAKYILEDKFNIPVNAYIASEYRYQKNFYSNNHLVIAISQSGETADTLASLKKAMSNGIDTLAIVNVYASTIAREADNVIYTKAKVEKSVATTKAYSCQLLLFMMMANMDNKDAFINLNDNINKTLKMARECELIANKIYEKKNIFYLGRLIDYTLSLEGALKLKEISYINTTAYPSGELKHGSIALIEKGTPVISIITDKNIMDKTISNIKEVKARGAMSIVITNQKLDDDILDGVIYIDSDEVYTPIQIVICLQYISYYVAKKLDCEIDFPKNLAKSVTVE